MCVCMCVYCKRVHAPCACRSCEGQSKRRSPGTGTIGHEDAGNKIQQDFWAISPVPENNIFIMLTRNCINYKICFCFSKGLIHYGRDNQNLDILLFQEVLEYMSRIDRVLSFPGGSLLLAGRSGVGRRTVTSVVSHMHGAVLFSPRISRGYEPKQFSSDLKHVSHRGWRLSLFAFKSC